MVDSGASLVLLVVLLEVGAASGSSKMVLGPLAVLMDGSDTGTPGVEMAPLDEQENLGRLVPNSMGAAAAGAARSERRPRWR